MRSQDEWWVNSRAMPAGCLDEPVSDHRHVDISHLPLQPLRVLKDRAFEQNHITPDVKAVADMAEICHGAITKAGGKERVDQLERLLAHRSPFYHLGDTCHALAKLELEVRVLKVPPNLYACFWNRGLVT